MAKFFFSDFSRNLPSYPSTKSFLDLLANENKAPKKKQPKLKDKLSKKQLKNIINEFEKSEFWKLPESNECPIVDHYTSKGISITLNGKTKTVDEINFRCNSEKESVLKTFLSLFNTIEKELSSVKKIKITK